VPKRKKSRYVPPLFVPKIGDEEAIEIATAYARSQGVATDGCQSCLWIGRYVVSLRKPANESEAAAADPDDGGCLISPPPADPTIAIMVTVDDRTGAAEPFYLL
jgi:hypothetical protein